MLNSLWLKDLAQSRISDSRLWKVLHQGEEFKVLAFWRCLSAYAGDRWENLIPLEKLLACSDNLDLDLDFSLLTRWKTSTASGGEHCNMMQCCDTLLSHFSSWEGLPFPDNYWFGILVAHLKMSSVLCSSTRFVFPLKSNSCKAPGSASGMRISVNSLQLKSTNCSIKKKKPQRKYSLFCHMSSYSSTSSQCHMAPLLTVSHKQVMKMGLTYH